MRQFFREFLRKLIWIPRRHRKEAELRDELRFHLETEAEERAALGMLPDEAHFAARRELGNAALVTEDTRREWGWTWLEHVGQDAAYLLRTIRRSPGLACVIVLTLGLGIGANTAIFSLLNTLVLRPLPVSEPERLVQLTYTPALWDIDDHFGYPQFERFREDAKSMEGVFAGASVGRVTIDYRGASAMGQGDACTVNFFSILGLTPQAGRFFADGEDRPDAAVAVLSDRYWRSRFGADPAMVRGSVTINQIPFTVIGVAPREFSGIGAGSGPDLWVPLHMMDRLKRDREQWTEPFTSWLIVAGRVKRGISSERAQAELDVIHRRLLREQFASAEFSGRDDLRRFVQQSHLALRTAASGIKGGLRERYELSLNFLLSVAGIVLVVACANVASLLLTRAFDRQREIAVRMALGAGQGRVARQLMTESLMLAMAGGALGLAIAWEGSRMLAGTISAGDAPPLTVHTDWRVLAFAVGLSLLTGILFGLMPAVRVSRMAPGPAMKETAREVGRKSGMPERALIFGQVALSVALIMSAVLFVRSLEKLWRVNPGYDRGNVLMFSVDAKPAGYSPERAGAVYRQILERVARLPDVAAVSASIVRPVDDQFYLGDRVDEVDGRRLPEGAAVRMVWNATSPGYFATIGTPVVAGRDFRWSDDEKEPPAVIVNESLARRVFAGTNAIGHRLGSATIVGLVKDAHYHGAREEPGPELFYPLFQHGRDQEYRWGFVSFELRYRAGENLVELTRREVAAVDRNLPVFRVKTLETQTAESLLNERLLARISSFFAALALALECVGLYGLMASSVARRRSEIGIRVALGARRGQIVAMVLHESMWLTLIGCATGLAVALWAARFAQALVFEVGAADPPAIAVATGLLIGVAMLAAYFPVRRALGVDPAVALRSE